MTADEAYAECEAAAFKIIQAYLLGEQRQVDERGFLTGGRPEVIAALGEMGDLILEAIKRRRRRATKAP